MDVVKMSDDIVIYVPAMTDDAIINEIADLLER